jgi:hypothetical protein
LSDRGQKKTTPKEFETLIQRTTNPKEPRTSQNKRRLEENDMLLPNPKKTRVFQEVGLDKIDDGYEADHSTP